MELVAVSLIKSMGIMSATEREALVEEMNSMQRTRKRFEQAWEEATQQLRATEPRNEIYMGFLRQVHGLTQARLLPQEKNRVEVGRSAPEQVVEAIYNAFPPLLRLEDGVWGTRTLLVAMPVKSPAGHYIYRAWRRVEEETLELVQQVETLTKYLHRAKTGDPFWSDMLSIIAMVSALLTPTPTVVDVGANEIYLWQFRIPRNIIMQVINCMWMPDRESARVIFHLEFSSVVSSIHNGEENRRVMPSEEVLRSVLLWNARGAIRATFWEVVQILHRRFLPDMLIIFNTGIAEQRLILVGDDRVHFDGEFTSPAFNGTGGVMCKWYNSRMNVACVSGGTDEIAYISLSMTPTSCGGATSTVSNNA